MTEATSGRDHDDVESKAREWMSYLYSGDATERGWEEFRAWLAQSPEHRVAFKALNDLWTSLDLVRGIEDRTADGRRQDSDLRQSVSSSRRVPRRRMLLPIIVSAATAAGIALVATLTFLRLFGLEEQQRFATAIGEVRTVELADGSQLVMRADTAIIASMSPRRRRVVVERGGAYFDVMSDRARPFIVSAGETGVRVRGTAFDVLKGPSSVMVSVTRGRVTVSDVTPPEEGRPRIVELTDGQQLTAGMDGSLGAVVGFDPERALAWREGRLSYDNARLEDIVADINRYREVKIRIQDEKLKGLRITTTFRVEKADEMLASIEATEPVTVVRSPSAVLIQSRAHGT